MNHLGDLLIQIEHGQEIRNANARIQTYIISLLVFCHQIFLLFLQKDTLYFLKLYLMMKY